MKPLPSVLSAKGQWRYSQNRVDRRVQQAHKSWRTMQRIRRAVGMIWSWFLRVVLHIQPWQPRRIDRNSYRVEEG